MYIRAVQGHNHGVVINPTLKRDTVELERTHIPHGQIDWKGLDDEPRMVLYKQSHRPDHDRIHYLNLRRGPGANLVFQTSCSDTVMLYRLQSSRRRLLANGLTCADWVNQKYHMQKTRKRKHISYFHFDRISVTFS